MRGVILGGGRHELQRRRRRHARRGAEPESESERIEISRSFALLTCPQTPVNPGSSTVRRPRMSIRVALTHTTRYRYDRAGARCAPHVVRLRPAPHCRTPILSYSLRVTPEEHFLNWQQDPFGNYQARLVFPQRGARAERRGRSGRRDDRRSTRSTSSSRSTPRSIPFAYEPTLARRAGALPASSRRGGPALGALVARAARDDIARAGRRTHRRAGRHQPRAVAARCATTSAWSRACSRPRRRWSAATARAATSPGCWCSCCGASASRRASCRATRSSSRPTSQALDGPAGVSEDVTDLHAWAEVYLPGAGWIGLDATSGLLCGEGHIPLACTADAGDARRRSPARSRWTGDGRGRQGRARSSPSR